MFSHAKVMVCHSITASFSSIVVVISDDGAAGGISVGRYRSFFGNSVDGVSEEAVLAPRVQSVREVLYPFFIFVSFEEIFVFDVVAKIVPTILAQLPQI